MMDTQAKPDESGLGKPEYDREESMNRAIELRNISLKADRLLGLAGRQYQLFEQILENTIKIQESMHQKNETKSPVPEQVKSKEEIAETKNKDKKHKKNKDKKHKKNKDKKHKKNKDKKHKKKKKHG